jgi:hypothetical protein
MLRPGSRQPANKNSPGRLAVALSHLPPDGSARSIKSDRTPDFLLTNRCAIRRVSATGEILDSDGNDITAPKLAVDCQIEHGQVASAAFNLELRSD